MNDLMSGVSECLCQSDLISLAVFGADLELELGDAALESEQLLLELGLLALEACDLLLES